MGAMIALLALDTFLTGWMLASGRSLARKVNHYTALCDELFDSLVELDEEIRSRKGGE